MLLPASPAGPVPPFRGRVAWISASAAPGRDGVGDYNRRMLNALAEDTAPGTHVQLAWRDGGITSAVETSGLLRLPASWSLAEVVARGARFLDHHRIEALAWGLVPQAEAPRGMMSSELTEAHAILRRGRRMVVFVHEPWCGTGRSDSLQDRLVGWMQRPGILHWLRRLAPERVFTSNPGYAAVLRHAGLSVAELPLCGNLPRTGVDRRFWPRALGATALAQTQRAHWLLAGVFGAVHPVWRPELALRRLADFAGQKGRRLAVVWFGHGSRAGERRWQQVSGALTSAAMCLRLGPLEPKPASELIEACDLGLPTIHFNLLGKSGTSAAFREHGVPQLVVADGWWPRVPGFQRPPAPPGVRRWCAAEPVDWALLLAARPAPMNLVAASAAGWARALAEPPAPSAPATTTPGAAVHA